MNVMIENGVPGFDEEFVLSRSTHFVPVDLQTEIEQGVMRGRELRAEACTSAISRAFRALKNLLTGQAG